MANWRMFTQTFPSCRFISSVSYTSFSSLIDKVPASKIAVPAKWATLYNEEYNEVLVVSRPGLTPNERKFTFSNSFEVVEGPVCQI